MYETTEMKYINGTHFKVEEHNFSPSQQVVYVITICEHKNFLLMFVSYSNNCLDYTQIRKVASISCDAEQSTQCCRAHGRW